MTWIKKGLIFNTSGNLQWSRTHAQVPIAGILDDKTIRIYYATRDYNNQSNTSYIDVDINNPSRIYYVHDKPILELGKLGTFDENGIMPTSIVNFNNKIYLYYIGWSKRINVPYHNSIGLAVSSDNGSTFTKLGEGPLLGSTLHEPYFTGTCYVLKESDLWKMWYLSCIGWEEIDNKIEPLYNIKYAESKDGIIWNRENIVSIDLIEGEGGIASASVIKNTEYYEMWYSYRGISQYRTNTNESYKIGYATSNDGKTWLRKDSLGGIIQSKNGWDSQMIAYPNVTKIKGHKTMFYNGNHFGKTGFGFAIS